MRLLGLLNFVVLQWFFVRLQVSFTAVCMPSQRPRWWDREIAVDDDEVSFTFLCGVVPLTGWWSPYRWVMKRP